MRTEYMAKDLIFFKVFENIDVLFYGTNTFLPMIILKNNRF